MPADLAATAMAVATAAVPAGALSAGGSDAARRIGRLINPPLRGSRGRRVVTAVAVAAAAVAITVLAVAVVTITRCQPELYSW